MLDTPTDANYLLRAADGEVRFQLANFSQPAWIAFRARAIADRPDPLDLASRTSRQQAGSDEESDCRLPQSYAQSLPAHLPAMTMYSSTFIFATRQFDDAFHRIDQEIAAMAKEIPGYLGEETWENVAIGLVSNVYYWASLDALQSLVDHPRHREAKALQANWLAGYRVIISEVIRTYGDGGLDTLLPDIKAR